MDLVALPWPPESDVAVRPKGKLKLWLKDADNGSEQTFYALVSFDNEEKERIPYKSSGGRNSCYVLEIAIPENAKQMRYQISGLYGITKRIFPDKYTEDFRTHKVFAGESITLFDVVQDSRKQEVHLEDAVCDLLPSPTKGLYSNSEKDELYSWTKHVCMKSSTSVDTGTQVTKILMKDIETAGKVNAGSKNTVLVMVTYLRFTWNYLKTEQSLTELLSTICRSLSLHCVSENDQISLYNEIKSYQYKSYDLVKLLEEIFDYNDTYSYFDWLLIMPLYWLMQNDGRLPIIFNNVDEIESFLPKKLLSISYEKLADDEYFQRHLEDQFSNIVYLNKVHPWIIHPFMTLASRKTISRLLEGNSGDCRELNPIVFVHKLIFLVEKGRINLNDIRNIGGNLRNLIANLKEISDGKNRNQEIRKCFAKLTPILKSTNYHWKDLKIWFKFVVECSNCIETSQFDQQFFNSIIHQLVEIVKQKLIKRFIGKENAFAATELTSFFTDCNSVLQYAWRSTDIAASWKRDLLNEVKVAFLQKLSSPNTSLQYLEAYEKLQLTKELSKVMHIVTKRCLISVLSFFQENPNFYEKEKKRLEFCTSVKFIEIWDQVFKSEARSVEADEETKYLQFIINWRYSETFYKYFYSEVLFSRNETSVNFATKVFNETVRKVFTDNITMNRMTMIMENLDKCLRLVVAIGELGRKKHPNIELEFTEKKREFNEVMNVLKNIDELKLLCALCKTGGGELEHQQQIGLIPQDYSNFEFCRLSSVKTLSQHAGKVSERASLIKKLKKFEKNVVFLNIWKRMLCSEKEGVSTLIYPLKAVLNMIRNFNRDMETHKQKIKEGNVRLQDVEFWVTHKDSIPDVISDIIIICSPVKAEIENIQERIRQYLFFKKCRKTFNFLLGLKEEFQLSTDLSNIAALRDHLSRHDSPLNQLERYGHMVSDLEIFLEPIYGTEMTLLDTLEKVFTKREMMNWLQQKLKAVTEINTLCDLALNFGNIDKLVETVSAFRNAVECLSPLLFGLENMTYKDIIMKCQDVKKNADANNDLLVQWGKSCANLNFFREIEYCHGSSERSSFEEAQALNYSGVYEIILTGVGNNPTRENTTKAYIPQRADAGPGRKKLSFSDLQSMQSILTLMSGSNKSDEETIAHFNNVFTIVGSYSETLISLYQEGCMYFRSCSMIIRARPELKVIVEVNFNESMAPLKDELNLKEATELSKLLMDTLTKWKSHVRNQKMEHYYLNEYSITQTVYLCHHLALYKNKAKQVPAQVYALLSIIADDQDFDNLFTDADACRRTITTMKMVDSDNEDDELIRETDPSVNARLTLRLLCEENGISDNVAKASINARGTNDIDDCINWCMLNEYEEDLVHEHARKFDEDIGFMNEDDIVTRYFFIQPGDQQESLLSTFRKVPNSFDGEQSVALPNDFLGIEYLGNFLRALGDRKTECDVLNRSFYGSLQRGVPNLHICAERDIYSTIISVYKNNPEQPLPSSSEVLLCSERTTIDEAERFMTRAMCKSPMKGALNIRSTPIFCLAFIDKLKDSVMQSIEIIYELLRKPARIDKSYQLIFIGTNPGNYLANRFEEYQTDLMRSKDHELAEYLKRHLTADKSTEYSAANLDPDRCLVKIVASASSCAGKSLFISKQTKRVEQWSRRPRVTIIRFQQEHLEPDMAIKKLLPECDTVYHKDPHLIHIDISTAVTKGIEHFSFQLLVLGCIENSDGKVWFRHSNHYYMIECTDKKLSKDTAFKQFAFGLLQLLPSVIALQPFEIWDVHPKQVSNLIFQDDDVMRSKRFKHPLQYLKQYVDKIEEISVHYRPEYGENEQRLDHIKDNIKILIQACGIEAPSWGTLNVFVSFVDFHISKFCKYYFTERQVKRGLVKFILDLTLQMWRDQSVNSYDHHKHKLPEKAKFKQIHNEEDTDNTIVPYYHIKEDGKSMIFLNLMIGERRGNLKNANGNTILKSHLSKQMIDWLTKQGFKFTDCYEEKSRQDYLRDLRNVIRSNSNHDPDPTYQLTVNNMQKILAIYTRLECDIPVILNGHTGCGKTRMIEFLAQMMSAKLFTKKVYGGISVSDIHKNATTAIIHAKNQRFVRNNERFRPRRNRSEQVILFFDEANTTEAIEAIKEIMCDKSCDGESFNEKNLFIVAACNPYTALSDYAVDKVQNSGLRNVHASEIGNSRAETMSNLLYKVVPLPASMNIFMWDFGDIGKNTEETYISQITNKMADKINVSSIELSYVICKTHDYMRTKTNECRFVTMRDAERCIRVCKWFYIHREPLFDLIDKEKKKSNKRIPVIEPIYRMILQALGVCYYSSLNEKAHFLLFCKDLFNKFDVDCDENDILEEFLACQAVFLGQVNLNKTGKKITQNRALKKNFFLMAICAELRIPLFVIGKPGSSKSLAKTIVSASMRGVSSDGEFLKQLKKVHMLSHQCSAMTEARGILQTFDQCSILMENNNVKTFSAVAVLDEIGLAEDSPSMPLKVLHPLLEFGSTTNTVRSKRVGFYGISNWALDPAKLNRGLFLLQGKPDDDDLFVTAMRVCGETCSTSIKAKVLNLMTKAYLKIYENQGLEFFGLRDFYSLIKSVKDREFEDQKKIERAIVRNFSGSTKSSKPIFKEFLSQIFPNIRLPSIWIKDIIKENLSETDSRFLLLLTNYHPSVNLLSLFIDDFKHNIQVVFGSGFPGDQNFSEICRNIHQIKCCMEAGKTVILLNLSAIHESLYDALNQHYVPLNDKLYVDIGLGGQRITCCISPKFRLIVLEQKDIAYNYPIPLLSRLEKHFLDSDSLLVKGKNLKIMQTWVNSIVTEGFTENDLFVGYQKDTISSALLFAREDVARCKLVLMDSACMDAVYRIGLKTKSAEIKEMTDAYLRSDVHYTLFGLLKNIIAKDEGHYMRMVEVVTFASILTVKDKKKLQEELDLVRNSVMTLNLKEFNKQTELEDKLDIFLQRCRQAENPKNNKRLHAVLIIQCPQAQKYGRLIECAKHIWNNKDKSDIRVSVIAVVLWSVERLADMPSFVMQQSKDSEIIYVDEVRPQTYDLANIMSNSRVRLSSIFSNNKAKAHNIRQFLKDCVLKACMKINDSQNSNNRYCQRVEKLVKLCSANDNVCELFQQILIKKIEDRENLAKNDKDEWAYHEANRRESLQEGGTFQKTLILHLKSLFSDELAKIISVIDYNGNLNLLFEEENSTNADLWLHLFDCIEIETSQIPDIEYSDTGEVSLFVQNKFPFSHKITDDLNIIEETIIQSREMDYDKAILASFKKTKIYDAIMKACVNNQQLVSLFIQDFINSRYTKSSMDHHSTIKVALVNILLHVCKEMQVQDYSLKQSDLIPLVYLFVKRNETTFKYFEGISEACPSILNRVDGWIDERRISTSPFNLHAVALEKTMDEFHSKVKQMSDKNPEACNKWIRAMSVLAYNFKLIIESIGDQRQRQKLIKQWIPISLLHLLLLQVLPNNQDRNRYIKAIFKPARLLVVVDKNYGVVDFTKIVCNAMRRCYEDLEMKILIEWNDNNCRGCRKKFVNTMVLTCGHHLCGECCGAYALKSNRRCPTCLNDFPEINAYKKAELNESSVEKLSIFKAHCSSFFLVYLKDICFSSAMKPKSTEEQRDFVKLLFAILVTSDDPKNRLETLAIQSDLNLHSAILKILLELDNETVTWVSNEYLEKLKGRTLNEFVKIILYCFEKNMLYDVKSNDSLEMWIRKIVDAKKQNQSIKGFNMDLLSVVCTIKTALRKLSSQMYQAWQTHSDKKELETHIVNISTICREMRLENYGNLVVRAGCRQYGLKWLKCVEDLDSVGKIFSKKVQSLLKENRTNPSMLVCDMLGDEEYALWNSSNGPEDVCSDLHSEIFNGATMLYGVRWEIGLHEISSQPMHDGDILDHRLRSLSLNNREFSQQYLRIVHNFVMTVAQTCRDDHFLMKQFQTIITEPTAVSTLRPETMFNVASIPKMTVYVSEFLLYTSLFIANEQSPAEIKNMLSQEVKKDEIDVHLFGKLLEKLHKIKSLHGTSASVTDVFLFMQELIRRIYLDKNKKKYRKKMHSYGDLEWTTTEGRKNWICLFHTFYLQPSMEYQLIEHIKTTKEQRLLQSPFYRFVYELSDKDENDHQNTEPWKCGVFSEYTKLCTLKNFKESLSARCINSTTITKCVLEAKNLKLLQYMKDALELQSILIKRRKQHSLNFENDVRGVLRGERETRLAEKYVDLWNKARTVLGVYRVIEKFTKNDISLKSPAAMFVPIDSGMGLCAKILMEYLIDVQNDLINKCEADERCSIRFNETSVFQLTKEDLISIDKNRDILPIVQMHATYKVIDDKMGKHHSILYNFDIIEKQIEDKFLRQKKKISKETLPHLRHKLGLESDWNEVMQSSGTQVQVSLPSYILTNIDNASSNSNIIYSAVRVLEDAIRLLAKIKGNPSDRLHPFLKTYVDIDESEWMELKILFTKANIQHCLALYQRLSWHRATLYFSRGLNPYSELLPKGSQVELSNDMKQKWNIIIENVDAHCCQRQLNELIFRVPSTKPDERLSNLLSRFTFHFATRVSDKKWHQQLPDGLCFKHVRSLFKSALEHETKKKPFLNRNPFETADTQNY